jgi:chorismate mutase
MDKDIEKLRREINNVDQELVSLLAKRFQLTSQIGAIKREKGLKVFDKNREQEILEKWLQVSDLEPEFLKNILNLILSESKKRQS